MPLKYWLQSNSILTTQFGQQRQMWWEWVVHPNHFGFKITPDLFNKKRRTHHLIEQNIMQTFE
ncbi:Uncharacterised protein [Vibrio cholerae]|nr:Uncharacterised protein [Vibrio cholerae]CSI70392.1 Uncharacterised protein [Vibrio cholerae]